MAPLGIDEPAEWCNSFIPESKANGKVWIFFDKARLNQVLIRPVHRRPTLNDIFHKLNNVKYLHLIDTSCGYHNLKLGDRSSYLTTFTCHHGRIRHKKLLFGAAPAGDMFQ